MQVFRLMGMPDAVIAFDELPEALVQGFEMIPADGFPRHWKEWMGKKVKRIQIPPEKDLLTGQVRRFDPIVEENHFFYVVDWMINPVVEKWQAVCDYVKQNVSSDFRLKDNIVEMALPLAPDKISPISLEPEDVVVIPFPKVDQKATLILPSTVEPKKTSVENKIAKCTEEGCIAEYEGAYAKNALRMHSSKKHPKKAVATA